MAKFIQPMLAHKYEFHRLAKWQSGTVYVQDKLDGVRCIAVPEITSDMDLVVNLYSRNGKRITSMPHIVKALTEFYDRSRLDIPLDGELVSIYNSFQTTVSLVRRNNPSAICEDVHFKIFDFIGDGNTASRFTVLNRLPYIPYCEFIGFKQLRIDESVIACELADALRRGKEGIMIRNPFAHYQNIRTYDLLKYKLTHMCTCTVIGRLEMISIHDEPMGCLGSLLVKCNDFPAVFHVGSGFTLAQRHAFWNQLPNKILVKYQELTDGGTPRFPIFVKEITHDA